jgi:carboxyl-terminal processing protease
MKVRRYLLAAVVVFVGIGGAFAADDEADKASTYELLDLFGNVFERVRADFVDEANDKDLIEAAVNGMLSSLDPHSGYLNPERFDDMKVQTQGEFGGLGIEVTMEGGLVKVVSPIDDTPAFRAGVQPGDLITHLDGEQILGMTLTEAVDKMRGRVGTKIVLTIRRANEESFDVTLTRAIIKIQSVRHRLDHNVGYIRISSFNEQAASGVEQAVRTIEEEAGDDLQGFVIDLRNNPGGLLAQAVAVSDAFLERGEIVSTRSRRSEDSQRFNAEPGDVTDGKPIVVLINGGSASASEIVAGALQDHGRAIVLGTQSFGKGSVQTIIPLAGRGAMRLTTARYYTPSGRSIQAIGIEPDIIVPQARIEPIDTPRSRREADLRGALDRGGENDDAEDGDEAVEDVPDPAASDYQLQRAIDLITGLALYSQRDAGAGDQ